MAIRRSSAKESNRPKAAQQKKGERPASGARVSIEAIRLRAYYNFLERKKMNLPGSAMTDWLEAERSMSDNAGA